MDADLRYVTATIVKDGKQTIGILLREQKVSEQKQLDPQSAPLESVRVIVGQIKQESPFRKTALKPGMQIFSINNQRVENLEQAVSWMRESQDFVTILALDRGEKEEQLPLPPATVAFPEISMPDKPPSVLYLEQARVSLKDEDDSPQQSQEPERRLTLFAHSNLVDDESEITYLDGERESVDSSTILCGRIEVQRAPLEDDARTQLQPQPPPGLPSGGVWGTHFYPGHDTMENAAMDSLGFIDNPCTALNVLCAPEDEMPAYLVNGHVYNARGDLIGSRLFTSFRPAEIRPEYDQHGKHTHWRIVR